MCVATTVNSIDTRYAEKPERLKRIRYGDENALFAT